MSLINQKSEVDILKIEINELNYENFIFKKELEKAEDSVLMNQKSDIDISKIDTKVLKYENFILTNIRDEELNPHKVEESSCMAILKKIPKKNCDTNYNKFSIKCIYCGRRNYGMSGGVINLGLMDANFDLKNRANNIYGWRYSCDGYAWGIGVRLDDFVSEKSVEKWESEGVEKFKGDIFSLKYDSIKGNISIFKNFIFLGFVAKDLDIKKDYYFFVELENEYGTIEMVDNI